MTESAREMYARSSQATQSCIDQVNQLFDQLQQDYQQDYQQDSPMEVTATITPITSQLTNISKQFLILKQSQRELGVYSGKVKSNQVAKQRDEVKVQSLTLENLVHQRFFLKQAIDKSSQWTVPQLLQMAQDEVSQVDKDKDKDMMASTSKEEGRGLGTGAAKESSMSMSASATDWIDAFLSRTNVTASSPPSSSYSHLDPLQHKHTLETLQSQLKERTNLQTKLSKVKTQFQSLQQNLQEKQSFLNSLPLKLKAVQQSTIGLEDSFTKFRSKNAGKDGSVVGASSVLDSLSLIGSKRQERLDLARELSGPLYTLYIQLQSYLDAASATTQGQAQPQSQGPTKDSTLSVVDIPTHTGSGASSAGAGAGTTGAIDAQVQSLLERHNKGVTLTMSTPSVVIGSTTWKSDRVTLLFSHFVKLNVVSVHVSLERGGSGSGSGSPSSLWINSLGSIALLENLFPEDDGQELPPGSGGNVVYNEQQEEEEGKDDQAPPQQQQQQPKDEDEDMEEMMEDDSGDPSLTYGKSPALSTKQQALFSIRMALKTDSKLNVKGAGGMELHPYHWLQYASGLHYAMSRSQEKCNAMHTDDAMGQLTIESTIKAVMQQLDRRIRSHATLVALVNLLETKRLQHIPIHPSLDTNKDGHIPVSRVVSWVENRDPNGGGSNKGSKSTTTRSYMVTIQRKSSTLVCRVKINAQYPSIPPLWSLQPSEQAQSQVALTSSKQGHDTESTPPPSLYDSVLGQMESKVNTLSTASTLFGQPKESWEKDVQDWILVHQLREIVTSWDTYQQSLESNSTSLKRKDSGVSSPVVGARKRRGRERRPVS